MANCPNCNVALQTVRQREGIYFHCDQCDGRAATVQQVRRTVGDRFVSGLVRKINTATEISTRSCPFCLAPMKLVQLAQPPLMLDSCRSCVMIWFDTGKFEELPEGAVETPEDVMARAMQSEAEWKIQQQSALNRSIYGGAPDEGWKWIPAILGFPVKYDNAGATQIPWATWSLSAVITIISFWAFFDLRAAVENFGFIPGEAFRYGGITFITAFFLHAGLLHLVGNLYFFLLFGGEVEEYLGWRRFLALTFLSALMGDCFQLVGTPGLMEPCIGASGGIAGVMIFYALKFPRGTLAFFFWRFGWVHLPSWFAFVLWLLLQIIYYSLQRQGLSLDNVGYLAHFGGVTTGFVLWLIWRKLGLKEVETPG